ncbi:MAG: heavy metal translocating P-type ATPase [Acidimicrobiales bacterium]
MGELTLVQEEFRSDRDPAVRTSTPGWEGRVASSALLLGALLVVSGGVLHLAGLDRIGDVAWGVAGAIGAIWSGVLVALALAHRRVGVDAIAVFAIVGALLVGELLAAALITTMLATGRVLEDRAARRARAELTALVERAPRTARRRQGTDLVEVPITDVHPGDLLVVAAGEVVPVDGLVETDLAVLDEAALTGEAQPVERPCGDAVRSGVVNAGGVFDLRATTGAGDSTYANIVRLVEQASASTAPFVRMADRYAAWFVPLALAMAALAWVVSGDPVRAVAVMVVATPCPLILAAPVAIVSGLARAARIGVIAKGGDALESLASARTLVLDKTGTLTRGHPTVVEVVSAPDHEPDDVLALAASLDQVSPHVLAAPIVQATRERELPMRLPHDTEDVPGRGVRGWVGEHHVTLGKAGFVSAGERPEWLRHAQRRAEGDGDMTVFVAMDEAPIGVVVLRDEVRADARRTIRRLRGAGIDRVVLATGDRSGVADTVGAIVGADFVLAERLPEDKLEIIWEERRRAAVVMVGDGINDAAALALADVGVALGARGATVASEAADLVLTVDRLDRLADAMDIARRSRAIARQSVLVGMGLSLAAMGFAAWGLLVPVVGALVQEGIDVAVIANALRAARPPRSRLELSESDAEVWRDIHADHDRLRPVLAEIRSVADALDDASGPQLRPRLEELRRRLVDDLEPHERTEGAELYPLLDRLLGSPEATATMTRAHDEISHYVRRIDRLLDTLPASGPDSADTAELRRLLYGLHAIAALHVAQEDESYFSLIDVDEP